MKTKNSSLSDIKNFINLNKGNVCYISSDDSFFIEQALDFIRNKKLDEAFRDFNHRIFYGHETDMNQILGIMKTLPVIAKNRLIIIREAHQLRDTDWQTLTPFLLKPIASTFLVFTGDKPDKRKKTLKEVMKCLTHFHFIKPYEKETLEWIRFLCKKHSLNIGKDIPDLLLQIVGSNLMDMENEILKLSQYAGKTRKILPPDVMMVTSRIKLQSIFDLTDAIGKKNQLRALLCLADLLESGQSEVRILAMIHRHIRLLRQIIIGKKKGFQNQKLANFAGISPFFFKEYLSQIQFWNEKKIEKTYQILCNTDRALKSSPISGPVWLENFILQTCH